MDKVQRKEFMLVRKLFTYFKLLSYMFRSYTRIIIVGLRKKHYVKSNALSSLMYCFYTKTNDDLCVGSKHVA
jgi:hypothetical protein